MWSEFLVDVLKIRINNFELTDKWRLMQVVEAKVLWIIRFRRRIARWIAAGGNPSVDLVKEGRRILITNYIYKPLISSV